MTAAESRRIAAVIRRNYDSLVKQACKVADHARRARGDRNIEAVEACLTGSVANLVEAYARLTDRPVVEDHVVMRRSIPRRYLFAVDDNGPVFTPELSRALRCTQLYAEALARRHDTQAGDCLCAVAVDFIKELP